MIITNEGQAAGGYLNYDGSAVSGITAYKSNQIIVTGNGVKRIGGIQACWVPVDNSVDPATLKTGALLIIEGVFGRGSDGAYIDPFLDPQLTLPQLQATYPNVKIKKCILTVGASHRIITLNDLGIILEQDKFLTILQTPMYIDGNTDGQPGSTLATLSCDITETFADSKNQQQGWNLR